MWDLNGHRCEREGIENVIGGFSVGEKNPAGESVIEFCVQNDVSVINTFYKHRESHKWTCYKWNGKKKGYEWLIDVWDEVLSVKGVSISRENSEVILVSREWGVMHRKIED